MGYGLKACSCHPLSFNINIRKMSFSFAVDLIMLDSRKCFAQSQFSEMCYSNVYLMLAYQAYYVLWYNISRYVLIHFEDFCLMTRQSYYLRRRITIGILITKRISMLRSFTWDHTYHNLTTPWTLRYCYMDRMLFHDKNNTNIVVKWNLESYWYMCVMPIPQFNVTNTNRQTNKQKRFVQ